jgi:hypothetical protein
MLPTRNPARYERDVFQLIAGLKLKLELRSPSTQP